MVLPLSKKFETRFSKNFQFKTKKKLKNTFSRFYLRIKKGISEVLGVGVGVGCDPGGRGCETFGIYSLPLMLGLLYA
jgi:hypothetical protein